MLEMTESAVEIPLHVPVEFVPEYPIVQGRYVEEDRYKTIIPPIYQWLPVFYATNAYPGGTPAWVLRRAADVRDAYKDTELQHGRQRLCRGDRNVSERLLHPLIRCVLSTRSSPRWKSLLPRAMEGSAS